MARPLPVNMLLAGTGAVLLISGIGGKSIGDVLKGSFGKLEVKKPNVGSEGESGSGRQNTAAGGGSGFGASPVSFTRTDASPGQVQAFERAHGLPPDPRHVPIPTPPTHMTPEEREILRKEEEFEGGLP